MYIYMINRPWKGRKKCCYGYCTCGWWERESQRWWCSCSRR